MQTEEGRYEAKKTGHSWSVFDKWKQVSVLKTVSPNATYNEDTVKLVVRLLNTSPFKS